MVAFDVPSVDLFVVVRLLIYIKCFTCFGVALNGVMCFLVCLMLCVCFCYVFGVMRVAPLAFYAYYFEAIVRFVNILR